jgi:hypothetical protein
MSQDMIHKIAVHMDNSGKFLAMIYVERHNGTDRQYE